MKELILDYKKWRCGGDNDGINALGLGDTCLLNDEGFMCCLGQFSKQINEDLRNNNILGIGEPEDIAIHIHDLNFVDNDAEAENNGYSNTNLTYLAININDNEDTTPQEKIVFLTNLFKEHDYEIKVINNE